MRQYSLFLLITVAVGTLAAQSPDPKPAFPGQTHAPAPSPSAPFQTQIVTDRLNAPWSIAFLPDGTFLVTENGGTLRVERVVGTHVERLRFTPDDSGEPPRSGHDRIIDTFTQELTHE